MIWFYTKLALLFSEFQWTEQIGLPGEETLTIGNTSNAKVLSHTSMANLQSEPGDPNELLICGICAEPYDEDTHQAKFLTCFHTFCSQCLSKLSNKEHTNPAVIQCPNCRSETHLPHNGVDGLQTNFYITSFREISKNTDSARVVVNCKGCHGHEMQPESYFCLTCVVAVCCGCVAADHRAKDGHSVISISKAETSYLQELNISHKSMTTNKRKLELIESEITLLNAAKETAIKDLETFMKLAQEQLWQRRDELRGQILDKFNGQQKALLDKQKQIKEAIKLINRNSTQAKYITKTSDISELKPVCKRLKEINEKTESILSKMDIGKNNFTVDTDKGFDTFKECLSTLSDVHCSGFLPIKITFKNLKAKAGFKSALTVEVYNHHGDKLPMTSGSFSVQVTDPTETEIHTELKTAGLDCIVTFTPKMSGPHQVSGFFLGQKLLSDQTHISVSSDKPILQFGGYGNGNGTFSSPWGITIDGNGIIYVADSLNRLIQKFSANGIFLGQFSINGHDNDCTTLDLALDQNNGLVYCTDIVFKNSAYSAGNNMLVFNLDGELQHKHNLSDVPYPISIAQNTHGDILISSITKKCLLKVDKEGNNLGCMGDFGYPGYITIADDNSLIVSDHKRDCIYILNRDGSIRHKFGSSGTGKGQLNKPWGVATDGENILVADYGNNRIQIFRYDGTFVSMIESKDDPLNSPRGLVATKDGHVYVVDCGNNCIKKYKYRDVTP